MTDEYLEANIKQQHKPDLWVWVGPPEEVNAAREALAVHWRRQGRLGEGTPCNMHDNPMCVDAKFITADPEEWVESTVKEKRDPFAF